MKLKRILFQGDSITDVSRDRLNLEPNSPAALGGGYANHIASELLHDHPDKGLEFFNRGISGNRVVDLYSRWKVDALNLQPNLISILIGVNDLWHEFMHQNGVELDRFETVYRMLLEYTKRSLLEVQLVICEPFVLPCGVVTEAWQEDMAQRQKIVEALAAEFNAIFVPFQNVFDRACETAPAAYWAPDGVHPSPAGHGVLARAWLKAVRKVEI